MRKIILTLFFILTLPMLALAVDSPFNQDTKPGEPSLKDIQPENGTVTVYKSAAELPCITRRDVAKVVSHPQLSPTFTAKFGGQSLILFSNTDTQYWILFIGSDAQPELACIVGAGKGFNTNETK